MKIGPGNPVTPARSPSAISPLRTSQSYSDIASKVNAAASQSPASAPPATTSTSDIDSFKKELAAYQAERSNAPALNKNGITGYQEAIFPNENGYIGIASADQQRQINDIMIAHRNDPDMSDEKINLEDTAAWKELTAKGLNSYQIAANAKYFYAPDGEIVDRATATRGIDKLA